jgi:hypothetical protein
MTYCGRPRHPPWIEGLFRVGERGTARSSAHCQQGRGRCPGACWPTSILALRQAARSGSFGPGRPSSRSIRRFRPRWGHGLWPRVQRARNPWEFGCHSHPPRRGGGIGRTGATCPASEPRRPSGATPEQETAIYGFRCAPPAATVDAPSGAEVPLAWRSIAGEPSSPHIHSSPAKQGTRHRKQSPGKLPMRSMECASGKGQERRLKIMLVAACTSTAVE